MINVVNLEEKFRKINRYWSPGLVGELNGQYVKLAKLEGEFVWHDHEGEDELFLVVKGRLKIELQDKTLHLNEGEMCIIPRGVLHKPVAEEECHVLLFEPKSTAHTGGVESELTVKNQEWI